MQIIVNNDCSELHYKFIQNFQYEVNGHMNKELFEIIFLYAHGIPTIAIVPESGGRTYYRLNSHELYETAIQYLIDHCAHRYTIQPFTNGERYSGDNDYSFFHFLFDDDGSTFTDYEELSEKGKKEQVQKIMSREDIRNEGGSIIKDLDYVVNVLVPNIPCRFWQSCGGPCRHSKRIRFDKLRIDTRWTLDIRPIKDPSVCPDCYEKLSSIEKPYYKFASEEPDKISDIIGKYYHNYSLTYDQTTVKECKNNDSENEDEDEDN